MIYLFLREKEKEKKINLHDRSPCVKTWYLNVIAKAHECSHMQAELKRF